MCGIAGIVTREASPDLEEVATRLGSRLVHRGPDGGATWRAPSGCAALAHRRLAIIDLAGGTQPMRDSDERLVITFNGEIYDYRELRAPLERAGATFRTRSDTEVILAAHAHGAGASMLRGMFAYAIWDDHARRLQLVRDRFGKKPLFYCLRRDGSLVFASEMKALLTTLEGDELDTDRIALTQMLALGYVPGQRTIYRGIRRVAPGHVLTWHAGRIESTAYWSPPLIDEVDRSDADWLATTSAILEDSIRMRLVSEVPLGAFLSGGLDSSVVVALAKRHVRGDFHTFSVRAIGGSTEDADAARHVSRRLGTVHHETVLDAPPVDELRSLLAQFDEPFADSSLVPTAAVSAAARQHVTVSLSGDGGDELFGGYQVYRDLALVESLGRIPGVPSLSRFVAQRLPSGARGKTILERIGTDPNARYLAISAQRWGAPLTLLLDGDRATLAEATAELRGLFTPPAGLRDASAIARAQWIDRHRAYLAGDILPKVDICSMRHSLEVRAPLLDHVLAEHVAALPVHLRVDGPRAKLLLRRIAEPLLPRHVIDRRKVGFSIPVDAWLRGPWAPFVDELLGTRSPLDGLVDRAHVTTAPHAARETFTLLSLAAWAS